MISGVIEQMIVFWMYLCICLRIHLSVSACPYTYICMYVSMFGSLPVCVSHLILSSNTSLVQNANELAPGQRVRAQTGDRTSTVLCLGPLSSLCVRVHVLATVHSFSRLKISVFKCVCVYPWDLGINGCLLE